MVCKIGVLNKIGNGYKVPSFKAKGEIKNPDDDHDYLMIKERKNHPVSTGIKIQADKVSKAFTKYPIKGLKGSKNADFYEFLTMGIVPYLTGSATMIAVFSLASKWFDTPAAKSASSFGKQMGLGVLFYGIAKTLSKKLIEVPLNMRYGIDVNLPFKKVINEIPENNRKDNSQDKLKAYQYRKVYESVDFPRWDLLYKNSDNTNGNNTENNKNNNEDRNIYYKKIGKKLGIRNEDLEHADQKVKPIIREKVIKSRLYSTLSSYLWAATGVGIAMQEPWKTLVINPVRRIKDAKNSKILIENSIAQSLPITNEMKHPLFIKEFSQKFAESCKEFVNKNKGAGIAGRVLLGCAIGMTLLGNFSTLFDFNKYRGSKPHASSSLIDERKEKVVC